jgi:hypothetical protein
MKYQVPSSKLQDIQTKTLRLTAKASDLGSVAANVLTIPLSDISSDNIAAADVLVAENLSEETAPTPSISGSNLLLTDVALVGSDLINLVIKLK